MNFHIWVLKFLKYDWLCLLPRQYPVYKEKESLQPYVLWGLWSKQAGTALKKVFFSCWNLNLWLHAVQKLPKGWICTCCLYTPNFAELHVTFLANFVRKCSAT